MTAPQTAGAGAPPAATGDPPCYLGSPTSDQALDRAIAALTDLLAVRRDRLRRAIAQGTAPPLEIEAAHRRLEDHSAALDLLVMQRQAGQVIRATWDSAAPAGLAGLPVEIVLTRTGTDGAVATGRYRHIDAPQQQRGDRP